ncbi:hypothetical protein ACHAWF_007185 [Thalassiosira exigua]
MRPNATPGQVAWFGRFVSFAVASLSLIVGLSWKVITSAVCSFSFYGRVDHASILDRVSCSDYVEAIMYSLVVCLHV